MPFIIALDHGRWPRGTWRDGGDRGVRKGT
jgi:hypothetical protein